MSSDMQVRTEPKALLWTGRILSGLPILFMLFTAVFALLKPEMGRKGMSELGYRESVGTGIIVTEIVCVLLYAIPQTAVLGAILLTAYLGGATASHIRVGQAFALPVIVAVLVWLGILLRDRRLRELLPLRRLAR